MSAVGIIIEAPWQWSWRRTVPGERMTFLWAVLIHETASVALTLYPLPG